MITSFVSSLFWNILRFSIWSSQGKDSCRSKTSLFKIGSFPWKLLGMTNIGWISASDDSWPNREGNEDSVLTAYRKKISVGSTCKVYIKKITLRTKLTNKPTSTLDVLDSNKILNWFNVGLLSITPWPNPLLSSWFSLLSNITSNAPDEMIWIQERA